MSGSSGWILAALLAGVGCQSPPDGMDEPDLGNVPLGDMSMGDGMTGEKPGFVAGSPDRILLRGKVVAPMEVLSPGEVLIAADRIVCVAPSCSDRAEAKGATILRTAGVIYPGLIDAHNHTQYNYLPPWQPSPPRLFMNRGQWAAQDDYKAHVRSVNEGEGMYGCQQVKYGEIRALVGGTTTIQGTGNINRTCYRTLVHNAEYGNELGPDKMRTNIPGISSVTAADAMKLAADMRSGALSAYVIHLAEGIDETSRKEFDQLVAKDLLLPQTVLIHGTALGKTEFDALGKAGGKLVWSPRSNINLYGKTTDIPAALAAGVKIALAPDWTPSGSASLLGEVRVAAKISKEGGNFLSAKRLTEMVTSTAAEVLGLEGVVGRLAPGLLGDVLVLAERDGDAYQNLLVAKPEDVRLVLVGGRLRYGMGELMDAVTQKRCEELTMCGSKKRLCVPDTDMVDTTTLHEDWAMIRTAIQTFYTMPYGLEQCME